MAHEEMTASAVMMLMMMMMLWYETKNFQNFATEIFRPKLKKFAIKEGCGDDGDKCACLLCASSIDCRYYWQQNWLSWWTIKPETIQSNQFKNHLKVYVFWLLSTPITKIYWLGHIGKAIASESRQSVLRIPYVSFDSLLLFCSGRNMQNFPIKSTITYTQSCGGH